MAPLTYMGLDICGCLVLGIRVTEDDLFTPTKGSPQCNNGHERPTPEMKYCPEDGTPFEEREGRVPKPHVEEYIKVRKMRDLDEMYSDNDSGLIFVHCVDNFRSNVKSAMNLAVGLKLVDTGSHRNCSSISTVSGVDSAVVAERAHYILQETRKMGIDDRKIELFLSLYFSH